MYTWIHCADYAFKAKNLPSIREASDERLTATLVGSFLSYLKPFNRAVDGDNDGGSLPHPGGNSLVVEDDRSTTSEVHWLTILIDHIVVNSVKHGKLTKTSHSDLSHACLNLTESAKADSAFLVIDRATCCDRPAVVARVFKGQLDHHAVIAEAAIVRSGIPPRSILNRIIGVPGDRDHDGDVKVKDNIHQFSN